VSSWVLIICKDGDATTSLGNIFPSFVSHRVKKGFSYNSVEFPVFQLVPRKGHMMTLFAIVRGLSDD